MTFCSHRNLDSDRLVLSYCEEVCVKAVVLYRVELKLVDNSIKLCTIAELEVNDVRCRSVGKTLKIFLCNCEKYVLYACTINVAWNETLFAELFDNRLVADLTDLAFQCEMFHFVCLFKNVLLSLGPAARTRPHCTKSFRFFAGFSLKGPKCGAKIVNNFGKWKIMLRFFLLIESI